MSSKNGEGVLFFIFISLPLRTKMFVFSIDKYDIARFPSCVNYQSSQISDILRGQTKPSKVTIEEVWRPASHSALKRKSENRPAFFSILFISLYFSVFSLCHFRTLSSAGTVSSTIITIRFEYEII
jgi:hypothetical protein